MVGANMDLRQSENPRIKVTRMDRTSVYIALDGKTVYTVQNLDYFERALTDVERSIAPKEKAGESEKAPIQAHSKSEFKRLEEIGANVFPPDQRASADAGQRASDPRLSGETPGSIQSEVHPSQPAAEGTPNAWDGLPAERRLELMTEGRNALYEDLLVSQARVRTLERELAEAKENVLVLRGYREQVLLACDQRNEANTRAEAAESRLFSLEATLIEVQKFAIKDKEAAVLAEREACIEAVFSELVIAPEEAESYTYNGALHDAVAAIRARAGVHNDG